MSKAAFDLGLPDIIGTEFPGNITVSLKGPTGIVGLSLIGCEVIISFISAIFGQYS